MSLIDDLKKSIEQEGEGALQDLTEGWMDKFLDEGRALKQDLEESSEHAGAADAIRLLNENKEPFLRLGSLGLARILAHWENDDAAEARRVYLATEATFEERRAAMQAAGDAAVAEKKERDASWEAVQATLLAIGSAGLKFLVKLAMSRLPI